MKNFTLILIAFSVAFVFFRCGSDKPRSEFSDGPDGIKYRLQAIGDSSNKADLGHYVLLSAIYKTEKDSVFWDSKFQTPAGYCIPVNENTLSSPFFGFVFNRYSSGDSLTLKVDKSLFFREVFDTIAPWFTEKDKLITAELKIVRIMNDAMYQNFLESAEMKAEAAIWQQKANIEQWVKENMKQAVLADSLLFYEKEVSTSSDLRAESGKAVTLCYSGSFLNGRVFDEANATTPVTINYGFEGQLLPGIEKVLPRLCKGESAKIIIPSHLAFGNEGSSNGSVPPGTPVVYKIKILDIK